MPLFMGTGGGSNPLLLQWLIIDLLDNGLTKVRRLQIAAEEQAVPDYRVMVALADCFDSVVDS